MKYLASIRWEWIVRLYKKPSYVILDKNNVLEIKRYLTQAYYGIAVYDPYSLSGLFVCIGSWIKTGHWPEYTHILMNVEPEGAAHNDFRFCEATSKGYNYCNFETALGHAKRIAFLTPAYYTTDQINKNVSKFYERIGVGYDFKFDENNSDELSCVEAYWYGLKSLPDSEHHFRCLKMLMEWEGELTPQMFFCPDFRVVKKWEAS